MEVGDSSQTQVAGSTHSSIASQTELTGDAVPPSHKCHIREVEKIIEIPIEIPVSTAPLSPRLIARPIPIELQVMKLVPRYEPIEQILDRLLEALNDDLTSAQQHISSMLNRILSAPQLKHSIERVLAGQRRTWEQLQQSVGRAIEANELEISRNFTKREPMVIQPSVPLFEKGDMSAFRPPLKQSLFMDSFAIDQLSYGPMVEHPRDSSNVEVHEVTNVLPIEVPVERIVKEYRVVESGFEVEIEKVVERIVEVPIEIDNIVEVERIVEIDRVVEVPLEIDRVVEVEKVVEREKLVEIVVEVPLEIEKIVEKIVEVEREVLVEVPLEVIREVPMEVVLLKEVLVEKEVPVEVIRQVERIVEVPFPFEVIRQVDRPVPVLVEQIVEVDNYINVPVQVIREVIVETPLEIEVEKIVEKQVERIVEVDRLVEVPVQRIVEREVEKVVQRIIDRAVEVPVECLIEVSVDRIVEVPVDKIVQVEVENMVIQEVQKIVKEEVRVQVPIDRIVHVEVPVEHIVQVPVEKIVEKIVTIEVPVERIVTVEVPVQKIVTVEKIVTVQVPVERIVTVEVPVDRIVEVEVEVLRIVEIEVERFIEVVANRQVPHDSSTKATQLNFAGMSPNRLDESSIQDVKTVGAFSELQHIEQTLQRHQEDLNKRYEEFQSQSKKENEVLRGSMSRLQDQINRLTDELTEHRKYSMKLEQENAIIRSSLQQKDTQKLLAERIDELEEIGARFADENEEIKLQNERLRARLQQVVDELEQARLRTIQLMEHMQSKNVQEVQHEIEDIKQWERLVDDLTTEKESLKGLIQEAMQKSKLLQQRNSILEAEIQEYKNIVKLTEDETKGLAAKVHELGVNQSEQEAVIQRLRADKANLKKSLEEMCADNQRLKVCEVDIEMYERLLDENDQNKQCLVEYRQEVESLTQTIESYKELLLRGDQIVGALCEQRNEINSKAQDLNYRQTMLKLRSRQTTVLEEGKGLNKLIHAENKRLLKEMYEYCEENGKLQQKMQVLETENAMLRARLRQEHEPTNQQPQSQPRQEGKVGTINRRLPSPGRQERQETDKQRLVDQLTQQLQQQKHDNMNLRKELHNLSQDLLSYERQLLQRESEQQPRLYTQNHVSYSQSSLCRDPPQRYNDQTPESSIRRMDLTQKRFNGSCRDTRSADCYRLAEELSNRLYDYESTADLRRHLQRFVASEVMIDRSQKRQSTMDMSVGGLSRLELSLKYLRDRTENFQHCIEQQTQRSEHTRYMARMRSEAQLPNRDDSRIEYPSAHQIASSQDLFPSTHELTFENFAKVFANTPEWTYYVMLRLTEAVDKRLAETGSVASLHPREIAVYNWEQQDPTTLVIRLKDEQPFDKPIHLYLAPEVLAGEPENESSLAWNLGVIFDYLVHGELYWRSKAEILDEHNYFRFRDEQQPAEIKRLVQKLVQRNQQQRLGICQLLVNVRYQLRKLPLY